MRMMASKTPNGVGGEETSDLAAMWQKAIEEYEKKTKKSLRLAPGRTMAEVMASTEVETNNFNNFRHSGGNVDKVRTAFKNNLGIIQKVVSGIEILGAAASAFPPAMPAGLIFAAFSQVTQSFNNVSADYDKVIGFYEFTRRFLDRLSMIEQRTPKLAPFQRCVVRVFSSMLTICAVAQDFVKEKRFKKWFSTLMDGSDSQLSGAYTDMEAAINELSQAVGLATLRSVEIIAEIVQSMNEKVGFLVEKVTSFDETMQVLDSNTKIIMETTQESNSKQDQILQEMRKIARVSRETHDRVMEKDSAPHPGQKKNKTEPGENKRVALATISTFFSDHNKPWNSVLKLTKTQRREILESSVKDTGGWFVKDEETFKAWVNEETPLLWVRGNAGIGKSFLAQAAVTELETSLKGRSPSAYFLFREEESSLRSWSQALYSLAFQMAEQDPKYAEKLSTALTVKGISSEPWSASDPWKTLFENIFTSQGDDHAYLVLDGIDEMKEPDRKEMLECLEQITLQGLNIHVMLSGRPSCSLEVEALKPTVFDVTKENLATDISKVIASSLKGLARLRKFRKSVKNVIAKKIKTKADGMRYVDHMLRRLSYIGREKGVINDLEKNLPENLDELYNLMLSECQANRTDAQYHTLKKLFAWLAYSKRALTLAEAGELISLTVDNSITFDIEDELIGRSARILELAKNPEEEEEDEGGDEETSESDDKGGVEVDIQDSSETRLNFQERSLREYFQAVDVDDNGLRTPPSAAHFTIFEMASEILFKATEEEDDDKQPKILQYAGDFWIKHLVEIDLNAANDEEVLHVVDIAHKVMTNHKNVARIFETFSSFLYSEMLSESGASWHEILKSWVLRASSSTSITLSPEVEEWGKEFIATETPLMTLARGHVLNWYNRGPNGTKIYLAFRFARDAFGLSKFEVTADSLETVLLIANHFPDIEKNALGMRAISCSLSEMELSTEAIEYINKGFELLKTEPDHDPALSFYLMRGLSLCHASLGKRENTIEEIQKAIDLLPSNWRDSKELVETVQWIYEEKAEALKILEKEEEAIQAFSDIRTVRPDKTLDWWLLDQQIRILFESSHDPDGAKALGLIRSWGNKERLSWFDSRVGDNDMWELEKLNEVASRQGADGKAFLLQCYADLMATLPPRGDRMACARAALATTYRVAIQDNSKAKQLYKEVLTHNLQDLELRYMFDAILYRIRCSLAEIIFEEFFASTDSSQKAALLEEIKSVSSQLGNINNFNLEASNISVMVALMSRVMGQISDYQSMLQKTFDHCLEGLSDTVGWNDDTSFRLLSKVLACVEGLERDSLIAISCQFSKVTEEPEPEAPVEEGGQKSADANEEEKDTPVINGSTQEKPKESPDPEGDRVKEPIHVTETTISTISIENGVEKDKGTIIIEEASVEPSRDPEEAKSETTQQAAPAETPDPYADEEKIAPNPDEEFCNAGGLSCDGECDRYFTSWTVPIYFCLLCTNSDLCPTCYGKRISHNHGEENKFWRSYCGKDHRYVRGPIKGWRGVKGGNWRIEGDDGVVEEKHVQEWLKELKADRWPKAWDRFWRRLEGVKDIGI